RVSGAGNFRLSLRSSRKVGFGWHLCSVVVPESGAHGISLPAALHASSLFMALSRGWNAEVVGSEVAAGIGPPRRALSRGQRLCPHRGGVGKHERAGRIGSG